MAVIKLYVPDAEKERLKEAAALCGMSLSSYITDRIKPMRSGIIVSENDSTEKRNKSIYVRVSEDEYAKIKKLADGLNLSAYGRAAMLSNGKPIHISVSTDDITSFDRQISESLTHFQNVIEALAYRKVLQPQESEKMLSVLSEMRADLKEMSRYVRNNRKSIRNAGLRWLKSKYKKELEKSL